MSLANNHRQQLEDVDDNNTEIINIQSNKYQLQ
jgi:hypothetical protein